MTSDASSARLRATAAWVAIATGAVATILLLHRLGADPGFAVDFSHLWSWIEGRPPERVLLGLGRAVALALAYWVAATVLLSTAARASGIPALVRSIEWATLPPLRRLAERTVAVSLTVSTFTGTASGPAIAVETPPPDSVVPPPAVLLLGEAAGYTPVPAGDPPPLEPGPPAPPSHRVVPPPFLAPPRLLDVRNAGEAQARPLDPAPAATTARRSSQQAYDYTVRPGDNLWVLAERHLAEVLARSATEAETATYWATMIETNRARLRSGDPDLIFPGEIVVCPATADVGL